MGGVRVAVVAATEPVDDEGKAVVPVVRVRLALRAAGDLTANGAENQPTAQGGTQEVASPDLLRVARTVGALVLAEPLRVPGVGAALGLAPDAASLLDALRQPPLHEGDVRRFAGYVSRSS